MSVVLACRRAAPRSSTPAPGRSAAATARPTLIVGRRPDRQPGRPPPDAAARVRPHAGRLPRQRPARDSNGQRAPLPVLGASWDLEEVIAERGVQHVIFTFSTAPHNVLLGMVRRCQDAGRDHLARAAPVRGRGRARERRAHRRPAAVRDAPGRPQGLAVRGQVHASTAWSRRCCCSLISPLLAALALAVRISIGQADLLPPAPHRPRRHGIRHAQVPHDEARQTPS